MRKALAVVLFFSLGTHLSAQVVSEHSAIQGDKNTIGISLRRFINVLFMESSNTPEILYTRRLSENTRIRIGFEFFSSTGDKDLNEYTGSLGWVRSFKQSGKWFFYFGGDATFTFANIRNTTENRYVSSVLPFVGIRYQFSKQFSLATEPGFFFQYGITEDPNAFVPEPDVFRAGLSNVGHIRVDFHF
ncbi:MAG: hypothetical protein ACPF8V_11610 [Luteibaculum sp.]